MFSKILLCFRREIELCFASVGHRIYPIYVSQRNKRNVANTAKCRVSCSRFDVTVVTSPFAPKTRSCAKMAPFLVRYFVFQRVIENHGFNQIKKCLRRNTPKNTASFLSEKNFLGLGAL